MAAGAGTVSRGPARAVTRPDFRSERCWPVLQIAPCAADYVELKGFKMQDVLR